jgi:hypothetical protein
MTGRDSPLADLNEDAVRRATLFLRQSTKEQLKEYMQQIVDNDEVERNNPQLTTAELKDIRKRLKFPADKPFICGHTAMSKRDRPAIRLKGHKGSKIFASHIACQYAETTCSSAV